MKLTFASKSDDDTFISELVGVYFGFTAICVSATWVMYYLSMYKEHRQKILDELTLHGSSVFLEHFILETFRLKPTFWGFARYATEATTISDIPIPKGCNLVGVRYYANRHPDYWDNPE